MEEQPKSKRGRPPKNPVLLVDNPNARNVRNYRARKKAEDEAKYLQEQRKYKAHYNLHWKTIQAEQPVYNDPPYQYREPEPQQSNDDEGSNKDEDKDESVSVKSSEELDKMIDEALEQTEADVEIGKNYEKNRKKRERKKALKKGNKIPTEDEVELDN